MRWAAAKVTVSAFSPAFCRCYPGTDLLQPAISGAALLCFAKTGNVPQDIWSRHFRNSYTAAVVTPSVVSPHLFLKTLWPWEPSNQHFTLPAGTSNGFRCPDLTFNFFSLTSRVWPVIRLPQRSLTSLSISCPDPHNILINMSRTFYQKALPVLLRCFDFWIMSYLIEFHVLMLEQISTRKIIIFQRNWLTPEFFLRQVTWVLLWYQKWVFQISDLHELKLPYVWHYNLDSSSPKLITLIICHPT